MRSLDSSSPLPLEALDRSLAGEATPDDVQAVASWLERNPQRLGRFRTFGVRGAWDTDGASTRFQHAMRAAVRDPMVADTGRRAPKAGTGWWRMSAGASALALAALALAGPIGRWMTARPSHTAAPVVQRYATTAGQRATITLADGSRMMLAPLTTANVDARGVVHLSGEAYFEVVHRADRTFLVRTGDVTTRVLGTAFSVRHYPDDAAVRVAVASGRVMLGDTTARTLTLAAGDLGVMSDSTALATPVGSVEPYTAWTTGRLVFRDTPVSEALATLGRWYGYEFRLADTALASGTVTAQLDYHGARDMFTALRSLLDVTLTFDGRVVTLHPRASARRTPAIRAPERRVPPESAAPLSPSLSGLGR